MKATFLTIRKAVGRHFSPEFQLQRSNFEFFNDRVNDFSRDGGELVCSFTCFQDRLSGNVNGSQCEIVSYSIGTNNTCLNDRGVRD